MLNFDYDFEEEEDSGVSFYGSDVSQVEPSTEKEIDPLTKSVIHDQLKVEHGDTSPQKLDPFIFDEEDFEKPFPLEENYKIEIYPDRDSFQRTKPLSGTITSKDNTHLQVAFYRVKKVKDPETGQDKSEISGKLVQIPLADINFIGVKRFKNFGNLYQFYASDKKSYDTIKVQVKHLV